MMNRNFFPLQRPQFNNNIGTNFLCQKSRKKQLRGSCTPGECKLNHTEDSKKTCGTKSPQTLPQAQHSVTGRKLPAPGFLLGRKIENQDTYSMLWLFRGLPKELDCVFPESKHWQEKLPDWRLWRTKVKFQTRMPSSPQFLSLVNMKGVWGKHLKLPAFPLGKQKLEHMFNVPAFQRST